MALNTKAFTPLDWTVVATGLVSLVALFLPWWGVSVFGYSATVSGWNTSYGWFGGLLVVVAAIWYVLAKGGVGLPPLPTSTAVVTGGVSLAGFIIVIVRWITLPRGAAMGRAFEYGSRVGIWIAAIAAAVQVVALWVILRESGEPLPWKSSGRGRPS